VLGDAYDEVYPLDGTAISLLRRSLERARLLLESIKNGTTEESRYVTEDATDHASFRQMRDAQTTNEGNLIQDAVIVDTPASDTSASPRQAGEAEALADQWPISEEPPPQPSSGGFENQGPRETPSASAGPADWLALLGQTAASEIPGDMGSTSFAGLYAAEPAEHVEFREHITRPLPAGKPTSPGPRSDSSPTLAWVPPPVPPPDEQSPSLAEMLAAFQAPTDGEWPEQPRPSGEFGAASMPSAPSLPVGESTWEALIGRDKLDSISQPLPQASQRPMAAPPAVMTPDLYPPAGGKTAANLTNWQQVVKQEEQVRQGIGALKETLAALRAVATSIEHERAELRGFLDGSKDAIDRLEDWTGKAMGLNLRQSPDHVRRYLPLSVLWVVTTRLKKILNLLKDASGEELVQCFRAVHEGQTYIPPGIASKLAERVGTVELTAREREVLALVAKGKGNREIGATLDVTEGTIKVHVNNILNKLNVASRTEAVNLAVRRGLVRIDE